VFHLVKIGGGRSQGEILVSFLYLSDMANTSDLRQVGEIYHACLEIIRKQPLEGFDNEVMVWLREARYQVMKEVEKKYDLLLGFYCHSLLFPLASTSWSGLYAIHYFAHSGP
jgi:hypothetical protein